MRSRAVLFLSAIAIGVGIVSVLFSSRDLEPARVQTANERLGPAVPTDASTPSPAPELVLEETPALIPVPVVGDTVPAPRASSAARRRTTPRPTAPPRPAVTPVPTKKPVPTPPWTPFPTMTPWFPRYTPRPSTPRPVPTARPQQTPVFPR